LTALRQGQIVGTSSHAIFDTQRVLQSRLFFAHHETLTLGDMLTHEVDLHGLRLLILSACQTATVDARGAYDEVRSLASSMIQAGAQAVLASQWAVDDEATYLLMVRFAQEWFPRFPEEPPAFALQRAQHWLRTVTHRELQHWRSTISSESVVDEDDLDEISSLMSETASESAIYQIGVRGRGYRYDIPEAERAIRAQSRSRDPESCPYADPYFWAGFQITGW
jgi:CHAT domain-containing protein